MERRVTGCGADLMGVGGASGELGGGRREPDVRESPTISALRRSSYFHADISDHIDPAYATEKYPRTGIIHID